MSKVVILQHRLLHYRLGLFERLRAACATRGIELHLVHGQASHREAIRNDEGSLPWAHRVRNIFAEFGERDVLWQPLPRDLRDADLLVVMQESRILSNYPLLLSRLWSSRRVAYWGHGANFQSDAPAGLREKWKRLLLNRVDWWFAYTDVTVELLRGIAYPAERITCLNNAIDNEAFERDLAGVSAARLRELRAEIDAQAESQVGLFCGSLYPDKRLEFMLEAADRIHNALPNFRMVVIGDGPSAPLIQGAAATRPWLKWMGVCKGIRKAEWFRIADVVINPGLVGLHILDSFCAGAPMITCRDSKHSPEIAYLRDGINGLIVDGDANSYANAVVELFRKKDTLDNLKAAAIDDARRYTLESMVNRFADGLEQCLAQPQYRLALVP